MTDDNINETECFKSFSSLNACRKQKQEEHLANKF